MTTTVLAVVALQGLASETATADQSSCPTLSFGDIAFGEDPGTVAARLSFCSIGELQPQDGGMLTGVELLTAEYSAGIDATLEPSMRYVSAMHVRCSCWTGPLVGLRLLFSTAGDEPRLLGVEKSLEVASDEPQAVLGELAAGINKRFGSATPREVQTAPVFHIGRATLYRWRDAAADYFLVGGAANTIGAVEAWTLALSRAEWGRIVERCTSEDAAHDAAKREELKRAGNEL